MRLPAACSLLVSALVPGLLLAPPAEATLRTVDYEAVVWQVPDELGSTVTVGAEIVGQLTFDDATADAAPDPSEGYYPGATHAFTIDSYSGTSTQSFLRIYNDSFTPPFDAWQVGDFTTDDELPLLGGLPVYALFFVVNGGPNLYASDAIPPGLPPFGDPSVFEKEVRIAFSPDRAVLLRATIVSVPEPGAAAGAVAVAVLLALRARRRLA